MRKFVFVLLAIILPQFAHAAVGLVQTSLGDNNFGGSSYSSSFSSNTTAGNTIAVVIQWYTYSGLPTGNVSSVTDSQGNSYTLSSASLATAATPGYARVGTQIAYATSIAGGANTLQVNWSQPGSGFVSMYELTPSVFDGAVSATAVGTNPSAGSITTTSNGDFLHAAAVGETNGSPGYFSAGSGWTISTNFGGGSGSNAIQYQVQTNAGPVSGAFNAGNIPYAASMIAFKQSAAVASSPTDTTPPVISSVSSGSVNSSGATIIWSTNESSDSQVEYGITSSYGTVTTLNSSQITSHSVALSSLTANTLYHYRVKSKDASGNLAVSTDATFTTTSGASSNGPHIYIGQTATGAADGSSCANRKSPAFFNAAGSWGSGATQIGPGKTVHFCGTISSWLNVQGSGASGNPITLYFEPNAKLSMPVGTLMNMQNVNYIIIDGGTNGIMENTDNGTALGNHQAVSAIYASGSGNYEVKNLTIQNLYVHTSVDDASIDFTSNGAIYANGFGSNISIHDNVFHDICWIIIGGLNPGASGFNVYNNNFYNYDHAIGGIGGSGASPANVNIYNNHFGATANWDTTANSYHHDGIHAYFGSGTLSGVNIYNNLFDGDWGANNTAHIFLEGNWNHVANSLQNFNIYNNVFLQKPGNYLNNGFMAGGGLNFNIYNNTFLGSGITNSGCIFAGGTNFGFRNNIVSGCTTFLAIGADTTFVTGGLNNNIYANATPGGNNPWQKGSSYSTSYSTLAAWRTATGLEANSIQTSSAGLGTDGRILAGSAAIGVGANLSSVGISPLLADKDGNVRGTLWDIGAYEYGGAGGGGGGGGSPVLVATLTTGSGSSVTLISATLAGSITATGGANATSRGFQYGLTLGYGSNTTESGSFSTGSFTASILSLACNTVYHFRSYAVNTAGTSYGADNTFTTSACAVVSGGGTSSGGSSSGGASSSGGGSSSGGTSASSGGGGISVSTPINNPSNNSLPVTGISVPKAGLILTKNLYVGITDPEVTALQKYLVSQGLLTATPTGYYGALTSAAVKKYQIAHGISPVGTVGPVTRASLAGSAVSTLNTNTPATTFTRLLAVGSTGADVTILQKFLISRKYLAAVATGYYDNATSAAVGRFQTAQGIVKLGEAGYGNVGPKTRAALNALGVR